MNNKNVALGENEQEKQWSSDDEWNMWTKDKTELAGSNAGVRLQKLTDGKYETDGSITYRFDAGQQSKWMSNSVESEVSRVNRRYIYSPYYYIKGAQTNPNPPSRFHDSKYVAKFDTGDRNSGDGLGTVAKVYDVGCDGSTLTVGLQEEELWVLNKARNLGNYWYTSATPPAMDQHITTLQEARDAGYCTDNKLINSITHISKDSSGTDKVVTKKIINGDTYWYDSNGMNERKPKAIAVDGLNRVWVSIYDNGWKMYVIDGNSFDNVSDTVTYVRDPIETDSSSYLFDKNFERLYYVGTGNKIYYINTSEASPQPQVAYDGTKGSFVNLTNDRYGNIWAARTAYYAGDTYANGQILRIDYNTKQVKTFDLNNYSSAFPYQLTHSGTIYNSYYDPATNVELKNPDGTYKYPRDLWKNRSEKILYSPLQVTVLPNDVLAFKNGQYNVSYNSPGSDRIILGLSLYSRGPSMGPVGGIAYAKINSNSNFEVDLQPLKFENQLDGGVKDNIDYGTIGYDINNNLWSPGTSGAIYYKNMAENSYEGRTSYNFSTDPAVVQKKAELGYDGSYYFYSNPTGDFAGNNLDNSLSDFKFYFSQNEIRNDESEASLISRTDVKTDITQIPSSDKIFIKVFMKGKGLSSPVLKKLGIKYQPDQNPNAIVEKRIFNYTDSSLTETSTFQPGSTVGVRLKVQTEKDENVAVKIKDYFPSGSESFQQRTSSSDVNKYCSLYAGDSLLSGEFNQNSSSNYVELNNTEISTGAKYLCYTYLLPQGNLNIFGSANKSIGKNEVYQIRSDVILTSSSAEKVIGTSNNYLMTKGYNFSNSQSLTLTDMIPVDDELSFDLVSVSFKDQADIERSAAAGPSYIYKRGLGQKSRGGNFYSLPATLTDRSGETIAFEPFYLFYNPTYYLFGNIFSGSSPSSTAFDFGSRSNAISSGKIDVENKLNSQATLYNYSFEPDSVLHWDPSNIDKNKRMQENIKNLISGPADQVCVLTSTSDLSSDVHYLDNKKCEIRNSDTTRTWPNGRVWYYKDTSLGDKTVNLGGVIKEKGTIIIDFNNGSGNKQVNINYQKNDFVDNAYLGLMVINGGKVVFSGAAEEYRGIIFVPGGTSGGGLLTFTKDGEPLNIKGSLVANEIAFEPRKKTGQYSVMIYSDKRILDSSLPGFENVMSIFVK